MVPLQSGNTGSEAQPEGRKEGEKQPLPSPLTTPHNHVSPCPGGNLRKGGKSRAMRLISTFAVRQKQKNSVKGTSSP